MCGRIVRASQLTGTALTVAAILLVAVASAPAVVAQGEGELVGTLPPSGGVSLMTWTGGAIEAMPAAAPEATSFWVSRGGALRGYVVSAPAFVNEPFLALFPDGWLPGQAVLVSSVTPKQPAVDCARVRCVALTFDDGPVPRTIEVLAILAEHNARATFFVEGLQVERFPEVLAAVAAAGHEIGNHTFDHPDLTTLSAEQIREQIDRAGDAIERVTGRRPSLLRPPYGAYDQRVREVAGMAIILWSVDSDDFKLREAEQVTRRIEELVRPGAIILMHDTHASTLQALPAILELLAERELVPVTISELYGDRLGPDRVYTNR